MNKKKEVMVTLKPNDIVEAKKVYRHLADPFNIGKVTGVPHAALLVTTRDGNKYLVSNFHDRGVVAELVTDSDLKGYKSSKLDVWKSSDMGRQIFATSSNILDDFKVLSNSEGKTQSIFGQIKSFLLKYGKVYVKNGVTKHIFGKQGLFSIDVNVSNNGLTHTTTLTFGPYNVSTDGNNLCAGMSAKREGMELGIGACVYPDKVAADVTGCVEEMCAKVTFVDTALPVPAESLKGFMSEVGSQKQMDFH